MTKRLDLAWLQSDHKMSLSIVTNWIPAKLLQFWKFINKYRSQFPDDLFDDFSVTSNAVLVRYLTSLGVSSLSYDTPLIHKEPPSFTQIFIIIINNHGSSGFRSNHWSFILRECCFVWSEIVGSHSSGHFNDWPLKLKAGSKYRDALRDSI